MLDSNELIAQLETLVDSINNKMKEARCSVDSGRVCEARAILKTLSDYGHGLNAIAYDAQRSLLRENTSVTPSTGGTTSGIYPG